MTVSPTEMVKVEHLHYYEQGKQTMIIKDRDYAYHARKTHMPEGGFCLHGLNSCFTDMKLFKTAVIHYYDKRYDRREYLRVLGEVTAVDQMKHSYNLGHVTALPNLERVNGELVRVNNFVKIVKGGEVRVFRSILHAITYYDMSDGALGAFDSHALFVNWCTDIRPTSSSADLIEVYHGNIDKRTTMMHNYLVQSQQDLSNQI